MDEAERPRYVVVFSLVIALGIIAFGLNSVLGYVAMMQETKSGSADAYVTDTSPNTNFETEESKQFEYAQVFKDSNANTKQVFYMKFDISSIPPNMVIESASLNIYIDSLSASGTGTNLTRTPKIYKVNSDWQESTITWNNRPAFGSLITRQDFVVTGGKGYVSPYGWASFDLTSYAAEKYGGNKIVNIGIEETNVICAVNGCAGGMRVSSKENGDAGSRPKMIITYRNVDISPPAAISDLSVKQKSTTSITLGWTATGDDGTTGTASLYSLWYSTAPFSDTPSWFTGATSVAIGLPAAAGTAEEKTITGLLHSTTYYFALKVEDELGSTPGYATASGTTKSPNIAVTIVSPQTGANYVTNYIVANVTTDNPADHCDVSLNGGASAAMTHLGAYWNYSFTGVPEGSNTMVFECTVGVSSDSELAKIWVDTKLPEITGVSEDLSEPTKGQTVTASAAATDMSYPLTARFWENYTNTTSARVPYLKGEKITYDFDTSTMPYDTTIAWKVIVSDSLENSRESNLTTFRVKPAFPGPAISAIKQSREEMKIGDMVTLTANIYDDYEFANITLFVGGKTVETKRLEGHNATISFTFDSTASAAGITSWYVTVADVKGHSASSKPSEFLISPIAEINPVHECKETDRPENVTKDCKDGIKVTEIGICDTEKGVWKVQQTITECQEDTSGVVAWVSLATVVALVGAGISIYLLNKQGMLDKLKESETMKGIREALTGIKDKLVELVKKLAPRKGSAEGTEEPASE